MPDTLTDLLQNANFPPETIGKIFEAGKWIKVKNQEKLVSAHTVCDKLYFVLKGGFMCRFIDEELEVERTINFYLQDLHPFMSCVDSFFSETKTQCELVAIAHSEVIEFQKKDLETYMFEDMDFFRFYYRLLTTAFQEENDFKMKIIAYPSEKLYGYLSTHYPVIIQRVPNKYIAEFMGISPEWLSKLKHRV